MGVAWPVMSMVRIVMIAASMEGPMEDEADDDEEGE